MLTAIINNAVLFPWFLVFLRLGGMIMVFPGIGDSSVNPRVRLWFSVVASLAMYPAVFDSLPALPEQISILIAIILSELLLGILFGIAARIFISAMTVAGDVLSFMSGFQASMLFDPGAQAQTTAPATLLGLMGTLLVLITGLHLFMIETVAQSYTIFPVGQLPLMGDVSQAVIFVLRDAFTLGVKLAAPVLAAGFLVYVSFGVLNRLVPQVQAFFVAMPLNVLIGLLMLGLTLGTVLTLFTQEIFDHALLFDQR